MPNQPEQAPHRDSLVETVSKTRAVELLAESEGVTLTELRAIVNATAEYPEDSMVRVLGVALCEDDDGRGEHWIHGIKVFDTVGETSRGDLTAQYWPWAVQ
ncbi:hypothetical protein VXE65_20395 [Mycolicibacterium conceptionense]|uniref:hypothetical protein n=1 Tax=Mycolicibacterium conceptionense TaxID=451644 RepID=UPI0032046E0F